MVHLALLPPVVVPISVTLARGRRYACRRAITARALVGGRKLSTARETACEWGPRATRKASQTRHAAPCVLPIRPRSSVLKRAMVVRCQIGFNKQHSIRACILPKTQLHLVSSPDRPETCLCPSSNLKYAIPALHSPHRTAASARLDPRQSQWPALLPFDSRIHQQPSQARFSSAAAKRKRPPTLQIASSSAPGQCCSEVAEHSQRSVFYPTCLSPRYILHLAS